jgi:hypothetical protein
MTTGEPFMKLLKIENDGGHFRSADGAYHEIDQITKEALLWLLERILDGSGEMDDYDAEALKNQAHQVVYKSIYDNLKALEARRQEFIDESERLFLEDYKRYAGDTSQQSGAQDGESAGAPSPPVT